MAKRDTQSRIDIEELTRAIKDAAWEIGFSLVGIVPAVRPGGFDDLQAWIQNGFAGEMSYIPNREEAYEHPENVLPECRSAIMLGLHYRTSDPPELKPNDVRVSRYAWGEVDYHDLLRSRMKQLTNVIHAKHPGCRTRGVVDTAPLLERDFARLAGLGWFGKNTMLIHRGEGSWFFLAAMLTDVDLAYDSPFETDHCGTCTRCLEACPTDAFPEPYVLDARKCLSYLTIELRDQPIPHELREGMGEWIFGCDLCQDVCPWNRKAPRSEVAEFQPQSDLYPADGISLLQMSDEDFRKRFRDTPLSRTGRAALLRNVAIALGNTGSETAMPALVRALGDGEPLIRGAAAWTLGQLGGPVANEALQQRLTIENDQTVLTEIQAALNSNCSKADPRTEESTNTESSPD